MVKPEHGGEQPLSAVEPRSAAARDAIGSIGPARTIYANRAARAAGGAAFAAGGLALGAGILWDQRATVAESADALVPGFWFAAAVSYLATRYVAPFWFTSRIGALPSVTLSGDLQRDLARIRLFLDPVDLARRRVDRLELVSVALPLVGLALLGPLSLHWLGARLLGEEVGSARFAGWVRAMVSLTAHAHISLGVFGALFSWKLRRLRTAQIEHATAKDGWATLLLATWICGVPAAFIVPAMPALALLTGVLFVPFSYAALRARVIAERDALGVDAALDTAGDEDTARVAAPTVAYLRQGR